MVALNVFGLDQAQSFPDARLSSGETFSALLVVISVISIYVGSLCERAGRRSYCVLCDLFGDVSQLARQTLVSCSITAR